MKRGTRPMFGRLGIIRDRLQTGIRFNASTLAGEFGVCTKTIHRDLDFLRTFYGLRVCYLNEAHCFELDFNFENGGGI